MEPVDQCPCCGGSELAEIARHAYALGGGSGSSEPGRRWADGVQREFVFTTWLPGRSDVELTELLCERCGVVVYSPRPGEADLDAKYAAIAALGLEAGGGAPECDEADRARRLRDRLAPHLPAGARSVLDIGGGDGRVLSALVAEGVECAVVDHNPRPVVGVRRLGATLADVEPGARFGALVLAHVLEHLASPGAVLRAARDRLTPGGVAYVEVPVEIWRGTPVRVDPVVHVNHFVGASLRTVLRETGWRVLDAGEGIGRYRGLPLEVAWALATPGSDPQREDAARAVRRRLEPGLLRRAARRLTSARRGAP
jgi:SAM-dependent methyltransferase